MKYGSVGAELRVTVWRARDICVKVSNFNRNPTPLQCNFFDIMGINQRSLSHLNGEVGANGHDHRLDDLNS